MEYSCLNAWREKREGERLRGQERYNRKRLERGMKKRRERMKRKKLERRQDKQKRKREREVGFGGVFLLCCLRFRRIPEPVTPEEARLLS